MSPICIGPLSIGMSCPTNWVVDLKAMRGFRLSKFLGLCGVILCSYLKVVNAKAALA
jgi:hypothetical protein